jgi:hypothetical protein
MDRKTRWVGFTGTQSMSLNKFSLPPCSNDLILSEPSSIKWFHLIGTRSQLAQPRVT